MKSIFLFSMFLMNISLNVFSTPRIKPFGNTLKKIALCQRTQNTMPGSIHNTLYVPYCATTLPILNTFPTSHNPTIEDFVYGILIACAVNLISEHNAPLQRFKHASQKKQ